MATVLLWLSAAPALAEEQNRFLIQADRLKEQALALGFQASDEAEDRRDHSIPDTSVYLSAGNSGARLLAAGLTVDGAAPAFSGPLRPEETLALQPGSMTYRLVRLQLSPGTHHLRMEVLLNYAGDRERRSLVLEQDCDIAAAGDLVVAPEGKNWLSSPHLTLHPQMAGATEGPADMARPRLADGPRVSARESSWPCP